jgi:tellurite resistance protein TerC
MKPVKDTYKLAKRIAITVVGVSILAIGIVMIIAPGPALILIPVGLAILGLEFAWARLWLKRLRESISSRNMRNHGERAENHRRRHME